MTRLTLATWDHDRAMPLHDGKVLIPEIDLETHGHLDFLAFSVEGSGFGGLKGW